MNYAIEFLRKEKINLMIRLTITGSDLLYDKLHKVFSEVTKALEDLERIDENEK